MVFVVTTRSVTILTFSNNRPSPPTNLGLKIYKILHKLYNGDRKGRLFLSYLKTITNRIAQILFFAQKNSHWYFSRTTSIILGLCAKMFVCIHIKINIDACCWVSFPFPLLISMHRAWPVMWALTPNRWRSRLYRRQCTT